MGDLRKLSTSQISLHTSKDDCWITINGKVYDVTKFLGEHPGGEDVLLHASASGDATDGFENVGHSSEAINLMGKFLIGCVQDYVVPRVASGETSLSKATSFERPVVGNPSILEYLFAVFVLGFAIFGWYYLTFVAEKK